MATATISVLVLLAILLSHTIADFVYQTNDMATKKSTSNYWLLRHTVIYSVWLILLLGVCNFIANVIFGLPVLFSLAFPAYFYFMLVNFAAHTVTDYITSRLTSYYWKQENRHAFFVTIGFDQFIHIATLVLTYIWLI